MTWNLRGDASAVVPAFGGDIVTSQNSAKASMVSRETRTGSCDTFAKLDAMVRFMHTDAFSQRTRLFRRLCCLGTARETMARVCVVAALALVLALAAAKPMVKTSTNVISKSVTLPPPEMPGAEVRVGRCLLQLCAQLGVAQAEAPKEESAGTNINLQSPPPGGELSITAEPPGGALLRV